MMLIYSLYSVVIALLMFSLIFWGLESILSIYKTFSQTMILPCIFISYILGVVTDNHALKILCPLMLFGSVCSDMCLVAMKMIRVGVVAINIIRVGITVVQMTVQCQVAIMFFLEDHVFSPVWDIMIMPCWSFMMDAVSMMLHLLFYQLLPFLVINVFNLLKQTLSFCFRMVKTSVVFLVQLVFSCLCSLWCSLNLAFGTLVDLFISAACGCFLFRIVVGYPFLQV